MRFLALILVAGFFSGCQTTHMLEREPSSVNLDWRELDIDAPESFSEFDQVIQKLDRQTRESRILKSCDVRMSRPSNLEKDLLFIRLMNWPSERFESQYSKEISPRQIECLRASLSPGV